jgi:hypothetical protein
MGVEFRAGYKQPAEKYYISVDWANELETGETLLSLVVTCIRKDDGSDQTTTFTELPGISGTLTKVRIKAGDPGKIYKVSFRVTTNTGNILEADVSVPIKEL